MDLGVSVLPAFLKDNTDRNRTSAVRVHGQQVRVPHAGLVAEPLRCQHHPEHRRGEEPEGVRRRDGGADGRGVRRSGACAHQADCCPTTSASSSTATAIRRGMGSRGGAPRFANHRTTADALPCLLDRKNIDLFEEFGVLNENEIRSRYEVKLEKYNKLINIEARVMKRMVRQLYLPSIASFAAEVADNVGKVRNILADADLSPQEHILRKLCEGVKQIDDLLIKLDETHHTVRALEDQQECANRNAYEVVPLMDSLREVIDSLEIVVGAEHWPVPSYNDILFYA